MTGANTGRVPTQIIRAALTARPGEHTPGQLAWLDREGDTVEAEATANSDGTTTLRVYVNERRAYFDVLLGPATMRPSA